MKEKEMNIAHILPRSVKFPLETHNGRYEWVLQLASIQASNGHDVTIYCDPESEVPNVTIAGINDLAPDKKINNSNNFKLAFSNDHDIYHSHLDNLHYEVADQTEKPIVYTQHWWPVEQTVKLANEFKPENVWAVPPTKYMYEFDKESGIQTNGTIYHGINLNEFRRDEDAARGNRLIFVSRIAPEKNLDLAIDAAIESEIGLDIVGKIPEKYQEYWSQLEPLVDGEKIKYLCPKSHSELIKLYSSALALLFPSDTNEPFGLVAIEAQACGIPVIMKRGGSRGELIEEGKTGFLFSNQTEFVESISKVGSLLVSDCINYASNFDVVKMAENYDQLYKELVS